MIGAAVAVAVAASTFAISTSAGAAGTVTAPEATRVSGADRFATSAAALGAYCTAVAPTDIDVYVASGRAFPDGLAAASMGGAVVLVEPDSIPASIVAAMDAAHTACGISSITIVGGSSAVSDVVLNGFRTWAIAKGDVPAPTRVSGADRYATALAVATALDATPTEVILVTGANFPDALAAGVWAHDAGIPIVLNDGPSLRADVKAYLNLATRVYIVGGTAAVPASIATELNAMNKIVERVAGADRAETAVKLAEKLATPAPGPAFGTNNVVLVNGWDFPDALSAGPLAAVLGAPLLLTQAATIPPATAKWHTDNVDTLADLLVVGGTAVVSAAVVSGAVAAATAVPATLTGATMSITAKKQAVYWIYDTEDTPGEAVKLTAVKGSPADGAEANAWAIDLVVDATLPLASPYAVTISAQNRTIEFGSKATVNVGDFISSWNASAAGGLFTAAKIEAGTANTVALNPTQQANIDVEGETEVVINLTFSRAAYVLDAKDIVFSWFNRATDDAAATLDSGVADAAGATALPATLTTADTGVSAVKLTFTITDGEEAPTGVAGALVTIAAGDLKTVSTETLSNAGEINRLIVAG